MIRRIFLTTAISTLFILTGCKSTSNSLPVENGNFVYPAMPIISETKFIWDTSSSEAMNVALMAKPSGIGLSLKDEIDGKKASIDSSGSLSRLAFASLGAVSGGLFTVVQTDVLSQGANNLRQFNPTIVDKVDIALVSENGELSYRKVREFLSTKVMNAVEAEFSDIKWGGVYSLYDGKKRYDFQIVINSQSYCKKARELATGDQNAKAFMTRNFADIFVDGENAERNYCSFGFYISAPYMTDDNNVVLVAEMKSGPYFIGPIIENYQGYVIVPDYYAFNRHNAMRTPYAYVSKSGSELLFEKPKTR